MCILLKLHYAKFDISRLFCSKVIKEKPLGRVGSTPSPLGKRKVKKWVTICTIKLEGRLLHVAMAMAQIKTTFLKWNQY